ncbi:MAG: head GIN domain-containing protein, partial [Bacillota bacterium]|nr:head GIN domain-containing protein [Bacillota bacterium]
MKKVSLVICALLVCASIVGATAQKNVTTTRQVADFNAVSISGGIDLYIAQGSVQSVRVEADDDIQKNIITEVRNGTLEIYYSSDLRFKWNKKMRVYITVPSLTGLNASGGSDMYSQGVWKINNLKLVATGGSDVKFEVYGTMLDCVTTGGSDLTLKGKVSVLKVDASGGSDMDSNELQADKVNVTASGGSDLTLRVST